MSAIDRAATFQVYEAISNVPQISGLVTRDLGSAADVAANGPAPISFWAADFHRKGIRLRAGTRFRATVARPCGWG